MTNLVTILVTNDKVVGGIRYSGGLLGWGQFGAPMVAYNWEGYPGCNWEVCTTPHGSVQLGGADAGFLMGSAVLHGRLTLPLIFNLI